LSFEFPTTRACQRNTDTPIVLGATRYERHLALRSRTTLLSWMDRCSAGYRMLSVWQRLHGNGAARYGSLSGTATAKIASLLPIPPAQISDPALPDTFELFCSASPVMLHLECLPLNDFSGDVSTSRLRMVRASLLAIRYVDTFSNIDGRSPAFSSHLSASVMVRNRISRTCVWEDGE
jgi:hypothetical protein